MKASCALACLPEVSGGSLNSFVWMLVLLLCLGCAGSGVPAPESTQPGLSPCPSSPNCVSSDADENRHAISPFALRVPPEEAWPVVREAVARMPRTQITRETPHSIHAECRSAVFGFIDDLDLELRPQDRTIAVRSASRQGYSDLGVNRRRVEKLREELVRLGVVEPSASKKELPARDVRLTPLGNSRPWLRIPRPPPSSKGP